MGIPTKKPKAIRPKRRAIFKREAWKRPGKPRMMMTQSPIGDHLLPWQGRRGGAGSAPPLSNPLLFCRLRRHASGIARNILAHQELVLAN
jgi:hypothetical protein